MSGEHDVAQLCAVLAVSRSGYYGWLERQRNPSKRAVANAQLRMQIRQAFVDNEEVYAASPAPTRPSRPNTKASAACARD